MLKSRTFGAPFNLLAPNLRASFNIGVWSQNIRGIKYTGGRYFAWGQNGSGTNYFLATAATLAGPWVSNTFFPGPIYDVASNGTNVVVGTLNSGANPALWVGGATLGSWNVYVPGMSIPRYVEWCSGFNSFVVSGTSDRAYSNATGSSWTVASYPSGALSASCLIYSAALNRYYDVRISASIGGGMLVYSGTTAASCSLLITRAGTTDYIEASSKAAINAAGTELQFFDWRHYYNFGAGTTTQYVRGAIYNPTTGALVGQNSYTPGTTIEVLCGATYFPIYNRFIGRTKFGGLVALRITAPSTLTVNYNYNAGYLLPTLGQNNIDSIISAPAGLVTIADNGQGYTNP
jgi:hypothetical protein